MWERTFEYMLHRIIRTGSLVVRMPNGQEQFFGDMHARPVRIRIADDKTLRALCLNPDLALGECYMNGQLVVEEDDLRAFLDLVLSNIGKNDKPRLHRFAESFRRVYRFLAQYNPATRARNNVQHHYDLSDELYELFLDTDRQYSCAYFASPDATLEEAQEQKKRHIAGKLLLEPGMSVLDIGSGWGGMGLTLAREFGCKVEGVTLSSSQHRISNLRARDEGMADRVTFSLTDYRDLDAQFDRIVSVGMFEHVGTPHYRQYFRKLGQLLDVDGVALLHTIGRATPPGSTNQWVGKYIFPGGYIPAMSEVLAAIQREGLYVTDVEVLRLHYAETLRHWYQRFMQNLDRVMEIYDERFCRMWRFYLLCCEMSFRYGGLSVFQFQITRKIDAVPITRNYLYPPKEDREPPSADESPA